MNLSCRKLALVLAVLAFTALGCRPSETDPPTPGPAPASDVSPRAPQPIIVTLTPQPPRPSARAQQRPSPAPEATATPSPLPPSPSPTIDIQDWHQAFAFQRNGDYDRAIQGYRALLAGNPSDDDTRTIRFHLGETYLLNDDPASATKVLSSYVVSYPDDATAWFLLGRAQEALEDWAGTINAFRAYRQLDDTLADYAGLRIARALEALERTDEAASEYETVAQKTPDNRLAATALERLAEIALAQNDVPAAAARYAQAAGHAPEPAEKARLLGLAGTSYLAAGQQTEAVRILQQVVDQYTATGSAYMALGELLLLDSPVNLRTQGLVYYHNSDHRAAVNVLTRYLVREPAPLGDTLYYLGRSHEGLGRWSSAINAYDQLIKNYPGNERYGAAWVRKARAQRRLGNADTAISTFREFARTNPGDSLADNALWEAARALEGLGRRTEAAEIYRTIVEQYPHGDVGAEAGFRAGILPYLDGDYAAARKAWQLAAGRAKTAEVRARALLWAGKAALALDDTDAAAEDFATAARIAPLSFDGLRARVLLSEQGRQAVETPAVARRSISSWLGVTNDGLTEIDRRLQADHRYERGQALLDVGLREEGLAELKALRDLSWRLPAHLARLAVLLDEPRSRHLSISCAERALILTGMSPLEAPAEIAHLAYPVDYAELVRGEADRDGLDPRLLAALIRQESRFNPTAKSYADARGLTQVIPSTGMFIAGKLGVRDFDVETLYRPYRSIEFGAWYLGQQLADFDDPILALAAYNGGPGNGRRWQSLTSDLDMLVASIHLDQTKEYVRRTMEQYVVYQALYDEQLSVISDQ
ncbi:MAG: tetratricopeptide repeat protein [Anaerolineae bacterium]